MQSQARFPWLTEAQSFEFTRRRFFGFDALERPVFHKEPNGFVAINKKGKEEQISLPVTRSYIDEGEVKLTAVVQIEFGVLIPEGGTPEELVARLEADSDLRNRIARRLESIVQFVDSYTDNKHVGRMDPDRAIRLSDTLASVKTRGLARAKDRPSE